MLKRGCLAASLLLLAVLLMEPPAAVAAGSAQSFRQQNGLLAYAPPDWFLEGYFIAREKKPTYVFGPVKDFVRSIGGTTAWFIEDLELERLEQSPADGKKPEYSVFLESVLPDRAEYWVFVVLPHGSAQAWFDARRAFHGRKANAYYGETQRNLERALSQGLEIKAELRFWIERGDTSLQIPEEVIMSRYKCRPVFDLDAGRRLNPAAKTK
jgi:hypothetical protein